MFKVEVKNSLNVVTHQAQFSSVEEANAWLASLIAQDFFGKSERWVQEDEPHEGHIETRIVQDEFGVSKTEYKMPTEFTYEIVDISAEVAQAEALRKSKLAVQLGADIMAYIRTVNLQKNLTAEEFQALLADSSLERIERFLWNGAFETAKALIQVYPGSFYTAEEKATIIAKLDAAIAKVA